MNDKISKKVSDRSILKALRRDPLSVEADFNRLPLEDQASLFMHAEDRDRLRLVEISHAPRELLRQVPATELWFTIKRLTPQDSLTLIKYSTPEQLQVICDIEWWRKDRLDNASMYEWLTYISSCGMGKLMEWFRECDWDQILWFFKENIVVFKRGDKDEDPTEAIKWPREEAPITYEGDYYFQVLNEKYDQLIRCILDVLAKHDLKAYHKICEGAIWEIPSQREEASYEMKSRRLAEQGFPPFDEAIEIYSPLDKKRFKTVARGSRHLPSEVKGPKAQKVYVAPRYPLVALGDRVLFINRVLSELAPGVEDRFLLEVASVANMLLVADGKDIDERGLGASLLKAIGCVNIGLEVLSEGDVAEAARLLSEYCLVSIFRVGLNEVVSFSSNVKKTFSVSWMKGNRESLSLLEPNQGLLIENLLFKRPRYFTGGDEFAVESIRDFTSVQEISNARVGVLEAEFVGRLLEGLFLKEAQVVFELVDRPEDLRFTGVLMTAWANGLSGDLWAFKPIGAEAFQKVLSSLNLSKDDRELSRGLNVFKEWILSEEKGLTREERGYLNRFIEVSKARFVEEFKDLRELPKPQFIHSIWVV